MQDWPDFLSQTLSTGRTQGLSGGSSGVQDPDLAASFFTDGLRRHRSEKDVVAAPEQLWAAEHGGLLAHLREEKAEEGALPFTDIGIILSSSDAPRAALKPGGWAEPTARLLQEQLQGWLQQEGVALLHAARPVRFRFFVDGSPELNNRSYGLGSGEFITGLLPNLHLGPVKGSRALLGVHLNLPGVWEGYKEVARVWSDQLLFTMGGHWLDNFSHSFLKDPGLYRLQMWPDGSLVHVVSPELQDRYVLRTESVEGGASVITIADRDGFPIAYLVLAVLDAEPSQEEVFRVAVHGPELKPQVGAVFGTAQSSEAVSSSVANALGAPLPLQDDPSVEEVPVTMEVLDASDVPEPAGLTLPKPSLQATLPPVKPKIEARPSREARLEALSEAQQATAREEERPSEAIQRTVVPGASTARILTLQEKGALLQKVHFGGFMEGYDVYLGSQGRVATRMLNPRATLQVRGKDVRLVAHGFGVSANGTPLSPGQSVLLTGENAIEVDGVLLQYEDLSTIDIPGWPYLGEVRRPGSGTYLPFGDAYRIGRDRRCRVRLPDEPHNDNLAWRASVEAGTTIRARGGDIPKARFYTDSIMVASEHAELDMTSEPIVRSLARHCYTFVRRGKEIFSLFPREGGAEGPKEMVVRPGDEMLVGNSLFQLNYLATDTAATISVEALEISPFDAPDAALPARRAPAPPPVSPKPITQGILAPTPSLFDAPPPAGLAASMKEDAARAEAEKAAIKAAAEKVAAERAAAEKLAAEQAAAEKAAAEKAAAEKATKLAAEKAAAADLPAERPAPKAEVIAVEERQWQLELSRPCKLVLNGWMVAGNAVVGNHSNANIVLPEVRATRDQRFSSRDYFKVFFRGKKGQIDVLQSGEASLKVGGVTAARTESVDDAELKVVRRDINGEPDFDIQLSVRTNPGLPDPRAAWLALDLSDRMVAALFTVGIPLRSERKARLGSFTASFFFDGEALHIKDYLDSYRLPDGSYLPAFKGQVGGEWQTLAEDGSEELLRRGESLLIGGAIYTLKA